MAVTGIAVVTGQQGYRVKYNHYGQYW